MSRSGRVVFSQPRIAALENNANDLIYDAHIQNTSDKVGKVLTAQLLPPPSTRVQFFACLSPGGVWLDTETHCPVSVVLRVIRTKPPCLPALTKTHQTNTKTPTTFETFGAFFPYETFSEITEVVQKTEPWHRQNYSYWVFSVSRRPHPTENGAERHDSGAHLGIHLKSKINPK